MAITTGSALVLGWGVGEVVERFVIPYLHRTNALAPYIVDDFRSPPIDIVALHRGGEGLSPLPRTFPVEHLWTQDGDYDWEEDEEAGIPNFGPEPMWKEGLKYFFDIDLDGLWDEYYPYQEEANLDEYYQAAEAEIKKIPNKITHYDDWQIPEILLPDPLPNNKQPPLTILLELTTFVHQHPSCIRAGIDYFLAHTSEFSEIIVTGDINHMGIRNILNTVDGNPPYRVSFRIGSYHWSPKEHGHIFPWQRNLSRLNRDLGNVLVIDFRKDYYKEHPENVLLLNKQNWYGDDGDRDLYDLVPVLNHFANEVKEGKDIRDILASYQATYTDLPALGRQELLKVYTPLNLERKVLIKDHDFSRPIILPEGE